MNRRYQFAKLRPVLIPKLLERDGDKCHYCEREFEDTQCRRMTVDHIVPISQGGTDDLDNLVLACNQYNGKKKERPGFVPSNKVRLSVNKHE